MKANTWTEKILKITDKKYCDHSSSALKTGVKDEII